MNTFITILILILMLGILLATHELGHLLLAKGFNVFCLEYSIGFGPRLFKFRKRGGETDYSLRLLPLGGYVSMYAEGVELEDGQSVPPERSIEGISAGKRALVMLGGIAMNLLFSLIFTFIYALAFPNSYQAQAIYVDTGFSTSICSASALWGEGELGGEAFDYEHERIYSPEIPMDANLNQRGYLIDSEVVIGEETYAAVFLSSSLSGTRLLDGLTFYPIDMGKAVTAEDEALGIFGRPDFMASPYSFKGGETFRLDLMVISAESPEARPELDAATLAEAVDNPVSIEVSAVEEGGSLRLTGTDFRLATLEAYAPLGERFQTGCEYFANFFVAIGQGLGALFSFDFSQLGSVVAMGSVLSQSSAAMGWGRTFFFYGGYLALNLAILNLIPIPGLDGWQLLVTGVEKVFRRKIPDKIKNIVSYVGLGLLLLLGVGIIVKDVIGLF